MWKAYYSFFGWIIPNEFDQKRGYARLPFATDFSLFESPAGKKKILPFANQGII